MYKPLSLTGHSPSGVGAIRMVAGMRLLLASAALAVISLDPSEPDRFVYVTYATLVVYTLYSFALYLLVLRSGRDYQSIESWLPRVDGGWFLFLVALSSCTNSIFFFFFYFSILDASFGQGFRSGLLITITSSVLFAAIGYA